MAGLIMFPGVETRASAQTQTDAGKHINVMASRSIQNSDGTLPMSRPPREEFTATRKNARIQLGRNRRPTA